MNCPLRIIRIDNARKNRLKSFLHQKVCLFFSKNLCFQQPLGSWRRDLLTSTLNVRLPCGPLSVVFWRLFCSIILEEIGHKLFFTGEIAFFSKIFVLNILGPKKWSYSFNSNCRNPFWTLLNCPLRIITLDIARQNRLKFFFTGIVAFFFQKFMFSATSWVLKKWYFNFNINCQVTLWTLINCCRTYVMFYNTRRSRPKSFHWKDCFFLQKLMFPATSWVMKKWSYNFNINCHFTLWTLISCSLTFAMFYNTRRNRP